MDLFFSVEVARVSYPVACYGEVSCQNILSEELVFRISRKTIP